MAAIPGRTLEPFANYIRLRDPAPARFSLNVCHQWLRQSYRESFHGTSVLHLWQVCKTTPVKVRTTPSFPHSPITTHLGCLVFTWNENDSMGDFT